MRKHCLALTASLFLWGSSALAEPMPAISSGLPLKESYAGQVALAHDWATAFKTIKAKYLSVRVWTVDHEAFPEPVNPTLPASQNPQNSHLYTKVLRMTDIGALLLLEYESSLGFTPMVVIPAERVIGIYP